MEKLDDKELSALLDHMVSNSVSESGSFSGDNERWLSDYKADKFDVIEGRSSVVSTDTRDLVEADMPSLARVFLGAGDPVEFQAVNNFSPEAMQEAKDKQNVVRHIIDNCDDSFRIQHDWLKASEFQSVSALEYGCEEIKDTRVKRYVSISTDELTGVINDIKSEKDVEDVEITETSDESGEFDAEIRITYQRKKYFMRPVPVEDIIISRGATTKNTAEIIGKRFRKTKSQLMQEGFSMELIDSLPSSGDDTDRGSGIKQTRYEEQGGDTGLQESFTQWANEEVEGVDVYALIDFDGDGIAERRHVVKVGNVILENEQFDHVPYAIISSMLMPSNLIGVPRAELTKEHQRTNSVLRRQILDNLYAHNYPRMGYQGDVDTDDLADIQFGGMVDMGTNGTIQPLVVPFIGQEALQVVAYLDAARSNSTGINQANQGLQADQLHEETATRFEGMEEAGQAKIELVARVIAETGEKDLWEGMAWFASHYQDEDMEVRVLGRPMTFNPTEWRYDHRITAKVGTGAGDDEKTMSNLTGIYQIQTQLIAQGSTLTDASKLYNTLSEMVMTTGRSDVSAFFNNPEQPDQIIEAERDILQNMVKQMEANQQNPLAEAAAVEGKAMLDKALMEQKFDAQLETMKMEADFNEKLRNAKLKFEQDTKQNQQKANELVANLEYKYTELELKYRTDIPGKGMEDNPQLKGMTDETLLSITGLSDA